MRPPPYSYRALLHGAVPLSRCVCMPVDARRPVYNPSGKYLVKLWVAGVERYEDARRERGVVEVADAGVHVTCVASFSRLQTRGGGRSVAM